jgi:stage II sporulation protein AA (anti-sigma F factor antagonist)
VRIEVEREGQRAVVRPHGEIDVQTVPALRHALDAAVEGSRGDLVLDLGEVTFLDSSGLGVVLGRFRRMPDGRRLILRRPRGHVRSLLDLAGVPALMAIEDGPGEPSDRGA